MRAGVMMIVAGAAALAGCTSAEEGSVQPRERQAARLEGVNTVGQDRDLWQQLLRDHQAIRRVVVYTPTGVEATTESDDPVVAARIVEHARAMEARIKAGARVRVWDPVFAELFSRHGAVRLEVTPTEKGVRIVESSDDPEAVALLWSHASGVNDFVREGHAVAMRETRRLAPGSPPPAEVAIGGVKHRILLGQPDAAQMAALREAGISTVVNFRMPAEHAEYDEAAAVAAAEMAYCSVPYRGGVDISDEVIDAAREALRAADAEGEAVALHCRTGNRVGPGWIAYRVLDQGIALEQAIAEAKAGRMVDPALEAKVRQYIQQRQKPGAMRDDSWQPLSAMQFTSAQRAQQERATAAKDLMFGRLFAALSEAMMKPGEDGEPAGPVGAIEVCKEQAPQIARQVGEERGVRIGRTSARLRNPDNIAPDWAGPLMAAAEPVDETGFPRPRFAASDDGRLGAVLPIKLAANCAACHGPAESIQPEVRAALASAYPDDRATGFKEGDLRGWFWIEVPAESK